MLSVDLTGRRALVTGASSGLGRHYSQVLARSGAHVTLAARRMVALEETAREVSKQGGSSEIVRLDVTDDASVSAAFLADGPAYDIVVTNAGVAHDGAALDIKLDEWMHVIDTDLSGVFRVAQAAAKQMVGAGSGGTIINVASISELCRELGDGV